MLWHNWSYPCWRRHVAKDGRCVVSDGGGRGNQTLPIPFPKAEEGICVRERSKMMVSGPAGARDIFLSVLNRAQCLCLTLPFLRECRCLSFVPARSPQSDAALSGSWGLHPETEGPHRSQGWDAAEL